MQEQSPIKVHPVMSRNLQVLALVVAISLTVAGAQFPDWGAWVCSVICGIVALGLLFFRETHIDIERRVATEVTRFLGFIPFTRSEHAFTEFQAVRCFRHSSDDNADTWVVALQPSRGYEIWLRKFSTPLGEDCPAAREFAHEISTDTGLELREDAA